MLILTLILSATFVGCICVLCIVGKEDDNKSSSASTNSNNTIQPEIHVHNNITTDNVSQDIIHEEIEKLRTEFIKKQELDIQVLEEIDGLQEILNNKKGDAHEK